MVDFYDLLDEVEEGEANNPYSSKDENSIEWDAGTISIDYLNKHFNQFETIEEMKNATNSESLKLFFNWLKDEGILN